MKFTRRAFIKVILAITALAAVLSFPKVLQAAAGGLQVCTEESNCEIGEFLYDDSYAPIATASCQLTSRYPNGALFLDEVAMTAASQGDGWYSYSFTTPSTLGSYRTQVCCTTAGDLLCIDKSFEAQAAAATSPSKSEIATAVWGYSDRTLSGFGTLVADVWNYSSRSLTAFGNLVSNIWSSSSRTLTAADIAGGGKLATQSDIETGTTTTNIQNVTNELKTTVEETRFLLEKVVNKPIIENLIEESTPDLNSKIEESKKVAAQIYLGTQYLGTKARILSARWQSLPYEKLLDETMELNKMLGEEGDSLSVSTLFGQANFLKEAWDWQETEDGFKELGLAKKNLLSMQTSLSSNKGKNSAAGGMKTVVLSLENLEKLIGENIDISSQKTIYARIREVENLAQLLDDRDREVDTVLETWDGKNASRSKLRIENLVKRVLAINRVPQAYLALNQTIAGMSPDKILKNRLFGAKALIKANKLLLARGGEKPFTNTWLEEGSIVFKSLITNPSSLISQEVPLKYYLPTEVKKEAIIEMDDGLSLKFDTEKNQYFVEGDFTLGPGETQTKTVRVDDSLWQISEEKVESLRKQVEGLAKPLEKTSYFAQGVTLKSDINVALDKILDLQKRANTPEQKIRVYRENEIELKGVEEKTGKLKELVTQAGSVGTLFGFVGGAQAVAVWGLIVVIILGFALLAFYMRTVFNNTNGFNLNGQNQKENGEAGKRPFPPLKAVILVLAFGAMTAVTSGIVATKIVSENYKDRLAVLGSKVEVRVEEKEKAQTEEVKENDSEAVEELDIVRIKVPPSDMVNVRKEPSLSADMVTRLKSKQEVERIGEREDWTNIVLRDKQTQEVILEGWVSSQFIEELDLGEENFLTE